MSASFVMHADRKKNSFVEFHVKDTPGKIVRRGEKKVGRGGGGIPFRSLSRTNFRRRTLTTSAIVSLHAKLDYRPALIVLQHQLVGGQGHVLRTVLLPIMFFTKFAKCCAKESDSAIKIDNRPWSFLLRTIVSYVFLT